MRGLLESADNYLLWQSLDNIKWSCQNPSNFDLSKASKYSLHHIVGVIASNSLLKLKYWSNLCDGSFSFLPLKLCYAKINVSCKLIFIIISRLLSFFNKCVIAYIFRWSTREYLTRLLLERIEIWKKHLPSYYFQY